MLPHQSHRRHKSIRQLPSRNHSRLVIVALIVIMVMTTFHNSQIPQGVPVPVSTSKSTVVSTRVRIVKANTVSTSVRILPAAEPVAVSRSGSSSSTRAGASSSSSSTASSTTTTTNSTATTSSETSAAPNTTSSQEVSKTTPTVVAPSTATTTVAPALPKAPATSVAAPVMKALFAKPVTVPKTSTTSPSAQKIVNTQKLGPTATLGASVMNSIASIDIRELSSATAVAQMYGISNADMKASMESANINVAKALGSIGGDSTKSALTQPLVTNMAAMANTISTLAKSEQREQFLVTAMAVVGKESIAEAAGDPVQAGVLTATIVSHAFGEPVSRDQIAGVFPALAQALYNQEKKVVTDGVFQKMYGHLPKTADDWKVVKQLAYGVNIADRDTGKSSEAKERYEKVNGVSLEALKNSTSVDDRNRYEAAIKTIDVVSANAIPLPPVSVKTPLTNQTSFGQKIKALFKASTYGFGR